MAKRIGADKKRLARNLDEALGAELTDLRIKKGWSQQKFADVVGFDETYIRQLERGTKSPTLRSLAHIAEALSVQPSTMIRSAEHRVKTAK